MIPSVVAMKAILLAGGKGTRLRPLTLHTPKPIVPIFDRPFLHYQLDRLKVVPEIDEVILSLNYQPRRIEQIFGDGGESGLGIRYVVEPAPLGTGGAVRYAAESLRESVVVFNGDVLTEIDLAVVIRLHRERKAKATIVLTPVDNPSAYGLVETDASGNIQRFLEKPKPDEITCNTIQRRHLRARARDLRPHSKRHTLVHRTELFSLAHRAGRNVLRLRRSGVTGSTSAHLTSTCRCTATSWMAATVPRCSPARRPRSGSRRRRASKKASPSKGPASSTRVRSSRPAHGLAPYTVVGRECWIEEHATLDRAIVWPNGRISQEAVVRDSILGRHCHVGRSALVENGVVLGDKSVVTDYSRL